MSILYEMQRISLNDSFYLLTRSFFPTTQFSRSLLQLKQDERTEIFDIMLTSPRWTTYSREDIGWNQIGDTNLLSLCIDATFPKKN